MQTEQKLKRLERILEQKIFKEEKSKAVEFLLNVNKQISGREKFPDRGLKMINSELRIQIDQVWNTFWIGGISNTLPDFKKIPGVCFFQLHKN